MSLGPTPRQGDIFRDTTEFCAPRVRAASIYALLHRECLGLFPDELFADLFADIGRRSVPPMVVAVVMVLQRLEAEVGGERRPAHEAARYYMLR